jgi:hypothetical protein
LPVAGDPSAKVRSRQPHLGAIEDAAAGDRFFDRVIGLSLDLDQHPEA